MRKLRGHRTAGQPKRGRVGFLHRWRHQRGELGRQRRSWLEYEWRRWVRFERYSRRVGFGRIHRSRCGWDKLF